MVRLPRQGKCKAEVGRGKPFMYACKNLVSLFSNSREDVSASFAHSLPAMIPVQIRSAVAWVRYQEAVTIAATPCMETPEEFGNHLHRICTYINENHNVEGLCCELPKGVQLIIDAQGDRQ